MKRVKRVKIVKMVKIGNLELPEDQVAKIITEPSSKEERDGDIVEIGGFYMTRVEAYEIIAGMSRETINEIIKRKNEQ